MCAKILFLSHIPKSICIFGLNGKFPEATGSKERDQSKGQNETGTMVALFGFGLMRHD